MRGCPEACHEAPHPDWDQREALLSWRESPAPSCPGRLARVQQVHRHLEEVPLGGTVETRKRSQASKASTLAQDVAETGLKVTCSVTASPLPWAEHTCICLSLPHPVSSLPCFCSGTPVYSPPGGQSDAGTVSLEHTPKPSPWPQALCLLSDSGPTTSPWSCLSPSQGLCACLLSVPTQTYLPCMPTQLPGGLAEDGRGWRVWFPHPFSLLEAPSGAEPQLSTGLSAPGHPVETSFPSSCSPMLPGVTSRGDDLHSETTCIHDLVSALLLGKRS